MNLVEVYSIQHVKEKMPIMPFALQCTRTSYFNIFNVCISVCVRVCVCILELQRRGKQKKERKKRKKDPD